MALCMLMQYSFHSTTFLVFRNNTTGNMVMLNMLKPCNPWLKFQLSLVGQHTIVRLVTKNPRRDMLSAWCYSSGCYLHWYWAVILIHTAVLYTRLYSTKHCTVIYTAAPRLSEPIMGEARDNALIYGYELLFVADQLQIRSSSSSMERKTSSQF